MTPVPFRRRPARVRQHDASDCGAACLYSVAAHHGLQVPIARIREYACTDSRGSNVLGLVNAAEKLGLVARGVRASPDALRAIPKPAIAHMTIRDDLHHFVVISGVGPRRVALMDPADGRVHRMAIAEFLRSWTGVLILLAPGESFEPGRATVSAPVRLWRLLRPHRTMLVQSFTGAVLHTVLGLSTAVYVQKLVDHALPAGNQGLLNLLGIAMLAVLAVQVVIGFVRDRIALVTGQKIDAALLIGYHRHLLELPERFFDTRRIGEITSRFGDAVKIRAFINDAALNLTVSVLVLLLSGALMLAYSTRLAAIALASMPLYGAIYFATDRLNRRTQRELMERAADVESELVQGLQAASTTRSFGAERWAADRLEARLVQLLRSAYRSGFHAIGARSAIDLVTRLVTITLLWIGGGLVIRGALTIGELMSFYALAGYLTGPVGALITANRTAQDALIAADRLFEVLDLEREEPVRRPPLPRGVSGDLALENVTFRYGAGPPLFSGLSMILPAGATSAIVGESGSGKSTIVSMLHGFYPLSSGRLTIGGRDVREFSRASLRRRIGIVPQRIQVLSATVAENVALGDPEPDLGRVMEICDLLGVTAFIERLPAGFQTMLGEEGAALSGGERQRIAVARALYRDPEVLVLDEATSSLDPHSERYVRAAVRHLREAGRTIIVISHRLSSVLDADRIIVLGGGGVLEEGDHAGLMRRGGAYRALWEKQYPAEVLRLLSTAQVDPNGPTPDDQPAGPGGDIRASTHTIAG